MLAAQFRCEHEAGCQDAKRDYSVFTSGAYRATAPNAAFPQEKPHFAALSCSE